MFEHILRLRRVGKVALDGLQFPLPMNCFVQDGIDIIVDFLHMVLRRVFPHLDSPPPGAEERAESDHSLGLSECVRELIRWVV